MKVEQTFILRSCKYFPADVDTDPGFGILKISDELPAVSGAQSTDPWAFLRDQVAHLIFMPYFLMASIKIKIKIKNKK